MCRYVFSCLTVVCLLLSVDGALAAVGRRALLIGNAAYGGKDALDNPVSDVEDYGKALAAAGFTVTVKKNLNRDELFGAVRDFGKQVAELDGIALLHYAGHGVALDNANYVVPIGASTSMGDDQLAHDSLLVDNLIKQLGSRSGRVNVVILDMCRTLPARGLRGEAGGLVPMKPASGGTLLAFSTRYGMPAKDGTGQRNSPYAQQLIAALGQRDLTVTDYFNEVRAGVRKATSGAQVPVEESTMEGRAPVLVAGGDPPRREQTSGSSLQSTSSTPSSSSTGSTPPSRPQPPQSFTDPTTRMEFVLVPGGEFMMGSDDKDAYDSEKPVHKVRVSGFYLGKYEVTQGEWEKVMGSNPSGFKKGPRYPVEKVSWEEAQEFIKKLNARSGKNYRLPTESEWEYAARSGGRNEKWSGTSEESRLQDYAWYDKNSGDMTHEVGTRQANVLGLHDMSGNVWEWVQDCWHDTYSPNPPLDGTAWETSCKGSNRVNRGGSWFYTAWFARAAYRSRNSPGIRDGNLGFRLALPLGQ